MNTARVRERQATGTRDPVHLKFSEYSKQIQWDLPDASKWGYQRGRSPVVQIDTLEMYTLVVPVGQGAPVTESDTDTVVLGGRGELLFDVSGENYRVGPRDLISIKAGVPFSFRSIVLETTLAQVSHSAPMRDESGDIPPLGPNQSTASVDYLTWDAQRSRFHSDLISAHDWGFHTLSGPHVRPPHMVAHLVGQPIGQSRPWHANPLNQGFFGCQGVTEFHAAGRRWSLEPFDILGLYSHTPYIYSNTGLECGLFLAFASYPHPPGEHAVYWSDDPGWPLREDASDIELETVPGRTTARVLKEKASPE